MTAGNAPDSDFYYTATNAQVAASLLQACCLAFIKPMSGYVRLLRLGDSKSAASCQQA